jgi:hypothetical protein
MATYVFMVNSVFRLEHSGSLQILGVAAAGQNLPFTSSIRPTPTPSAHSIGKSRTVEQSVTA